MSTGVVVAIWALVFILVTFGAIAGLIVIYQRSKRASSATLQPGDRGFEREAKIFTLYQNLEDMLDGFDAYVEETRTTFEMEKVELLREREEIARMHASVLAISTKMEQRLRKLDEQEESEAARRAAVLPDAVLISSPPGEPEERPTAAPAPIVQEKAAPPEEPFVPLTPGRMPVRSQSPGGGRAATIRNLQQSGLSIEDIAQEMGISRNEVALTLKLLNES